MGARTQLIPGYYVWEIPGKPVVVHVHLGVIDRLEAEVTLGKNGADVGGVLIGTIDRGEPSIVRVEHFEPVERDDPAAFEKACRHWQPDEVHATYAVGYFRSRAGDGPWLAPQDIELLDRFFPSPWHIALLIKPSAAKITAGFFFREDGAFQKSTPLEFPLGRRELAGEEAPPRRRGRDSRTLVPQVVAEGERGPTSKKPIRGGWVWFPLSFIFFLLGVFLGFQFALTMAPTVAHDRAEDYSLGLSVSKVEDNLSVKWNREAPAIHAAPRGELTIEDGSYTKSVALDTAQLQNGSIVYRNSSNMVRFRLVVYPKARVSVMETMEWSSTLPPRQ